MYIKQGIQRLPNSLSTFFKGADCDNDNGNVVLNEPGSILWQIPRGRKNRIQYLVIDV